MYNLQTKRITSVPYNIKYFQLISEIFSNDKLMKYWSGGKIEGVKLINYINKKFICENDAFPKIGFEILINNVNKLGLGFTGFHNCYNYLHDNKNDIEIGIILLQKYQADGLKEEIIPELMKYGFDILKYKRILATVEPNNYASLIGLKKLSTLYNGIQFPKTKLEHRGERIIFSFSKYA